MIRLDRLCAGYNGRAVLHEVDLHVTRGEMVGLLGPNGSGKTTLLLALAGALPALSGRVFLDGRPLEAMTPRERARQAASVPQRCAPPPGLAVLSVALMGRYPHVSFFGGYSEEDHGIALASLEETRAGDLAARPADALSGGEWQRVLIARALTQQADLLLLDEAAAGLDPARQAETAGLLLARNRAGTTVISALHDLNLAALTCSRLVFLKAGRVALDGPTDAVFTADNLSRIYETRILVSRHPEGGAPQAHLAPGAGPASGGPDRGR